MESAMNMVAALSRDLERTGELIPCRLSPAAECSPA